MMKILYVISDSGPTGSGSGFWSWAFAFGSVVLLFYNIASFVCYHGHGRLL